MTSPLAAYLCPPGYAGPRGLRAIAGETSVVWEARHLVRRRASPAMPLLGSDHDTNRRSGHRSEWGRNRPVLLVPGFLAGDATLRPLATRLRAHGYRTYRSRMHANIGCTQAAGAALERRLESIVSRREHPVAVVGHSLGGLLAKALAHRRPDLVAGVVTLGSPLLAPGAVHPVLALDLLLLNHLQRWGFGGLLGSDCTSGDCARLSWEQLNAPSRPGFAFTSIYSRRDGIVDWRACLDPAATQVEVGCSHLGMAVDAAVHTQVLAGLARINAGRPGRPNRPGRAGRAGRPGRPGRAATGGPRRAASR